MPNVSLFGPVYVRERLHEVNHIKWRRSVVLARVLETIREYEMLQKGDSIVVGVSGGADSVALLHLLWGLKDRHELKLFVAHLNHMFRGRESEEDAEYVEALCKSLSLPVYVESFDVPAYIRETGLSSEDASRIIRYELYRKVARTVGASKVALGHNADDQAETVLMRILRGTGSTGLSGIPPVRMMDDLMIIRPLINVRRALIEEYCREHGLVPRVDSTNLKPMYMRNRIRLELLPLLEKEYGASVVSHLTVLADLMRQEDAYMESEAERAYARCRIDGTEVCLSVSKVSVLPVALQRRVIRRALAECKGDVLNIEFGHVEGVLKQLSSDRVNWQLHLPQGLVVQKEYYVLRFLLQPEEQGEGDKEFEYVLEVPGMTFIPEGRIVLEAEVLHASNPTERRAIIDTLDGKKRVGFDREFLPPELLVRSRQPGDRMDVFGMHGSKKVKDILIDEKVPPHKRERIPVLAGNDVVYWVIGLRAGRNACITERTTEIVVITARMTS